MKAKKRLKVFWETREITTISFKPNRSTPTATGGTVTILAPTAAAVSASGRVMTAHGRGLRNARLTLTDSSGNTRTAISTTFGYYRFDEVAAGETYIFTATGRRSTFGQNTQVHSIMEVTDNIIFIADNLLVIP